MAQVLPYKQLPATDKEILDLFEKFKIAQRERIIADFYYQMACRRYKKELYNV